MPIPLPDLDNRRWADLVEEARSLIPGLAPTWSDHNVHDPGITLIELLAWLIEQDVYRANRIPDRHRRKFLALIGLNQAPPRPAHAALTVVLKDGSGNLELPAGTTVSASSGAGSLVRFRTLEGLTATDARIQAVQAFDGQTFADQTALWLEGVPFQPFGSDPPLADIADHERQSAFYVGFDPPPRTDETLSLWLRPEGPRTDERERRRIWAETREQAEASRPMAPAKRCGGEPPGSHRYRVLPGEYADATPPHHAVRLVWELYVGAWRPLDVQTREVVDETRGLTLTSRVAFTPPSELVRRRIGTVSEELFYLRCRLAAGPPDAAPVLRDMSENTVGVEQTSPARQTFSIAPGVQPPVRKKPVRGRSGRLRLAIAEDDAITTLAFGPDEDGPEVLVLDHRPAEQELTVTLVLVGRGTGLPAQRALLPGAPVANGRAEVWTLSPGGALAWRQRRDLDASGPADPDFALDSGSGEMLFGDGLRGRVVPKGEPILASFQTTVARAGNVAGSAEWRLAGADDVLNRALLGRNPNTFEARLVLTSRSGAAGGSDEEELQRATARGAAVLWAHERLLELSQRPEQATLDQLDRSEVLARPAPPRAVTLLDFERLALDVPGTRVERARAWAELDPRYPSLRAPGTVAVAIVPGLPENRPVPSRALLEAVRRHLERRRPLGTRLLVVGPDYVDVTVVARVRAHAGADSTRIRTDVVASLANFLHPLHGGPVARGWPFGRDVYRSEILQRIDAVPGVDHVLALELRGPGERGLCDNVRVGSTCLVASGAHEIEVVA